MNLTQTAKPVVRRKPSARENEVEALVDQQTLVLQSQRDLNQ